ncbi:hypothetical protein HDA39_007300 [Kribbella italica]|uniref:Uncharacterized protein n=1 Tax=Kribbella italica TaxID=1540520 RepID=A0A7W9JEA7_9ACTN|nr:hypothetical protein [Kribbella italica]
MSGSAGCPVSVCCGLPQPRVWVTLEFRSIGTNGYVSTWGAITGICPPKGR